MSTASLAVGPGAIPVGDVAASLGVDPERGLTTEEAWRRSLQAGPNEIAPAVREPLWRIVLDAATEPFVLMLAAAGGLAVLLGETRDGLLVLAGLLPIVGADIVTEYRGERAVEALRAASAPTARVRRDGQVLTVPAATLVPGDVVLVQAGDVVPADARIARAERLLLDRSVLTGESIPETGTVAPDDAGAPLAERRSIAYAGTSVVGGRGEGIVVAIGTGTEFGRIAGELATRERRRSPLQRELDRLVRILLVVAIGLIVFTSGIGFVRGHPLGANVLAGISSAIAAIPEEPPVLLAVILGLGAYRLLRRGVLVRRLNAEETLGAVDLIVTDKTGTITQNRLEVSSVRTPAGDVAEPLERRAILEAAYRAEEDAWPGEAVAPSSFTRALGTAIVAAGGETSLDRNDLIEATAPTERHPVTSTVARVDGTVQRLLLGAPEVVLRMATDQGADPTGWEERITASAGAGERLVALARRREPGDWAMVALIGFADPIRTGIRDAMAMADGAGIQVVVVTGDHPATASAIARTAGLRADRIVTGEELDAWDDARLAAELRDLHVVARSTPDQKRRLVNAARTDRRIVAVTGDGVNDAPALHGADVAVAMGSGTAVAREASDLVLGDDSFATLMFGLAEGRRIVDNVQKGLVFLISTHVAFLGFILISTIAVAERQVLLPLQILWMELFIDLSTSIAFEREPPEPGVMTRPPRHAGEPLLPNRILLGIAGAGGFTAAAALVAMLVHGGAFDHASWLAYTVLVASQCVRAYANRSVRQPVHRLGRNGFLLLACLAALVIQAAIPYIPPLADAFRATPLDALDWLVVAIVALLPAALAEVVRTVRRGSVAWIA
ncbi:MAG TPA: HAD-IC family P-type ATPase [Candidatus Limnocylindrales bacterium]|nr:HAD-IC family P-type ATPase [Candidatus Limnocylindrales bacterium]